MARNHTDAGLPAAILVQRTLSASNRFSWIFTPSHSGPGVTHVVLVVTMSEPSSNTWALVCPLDWE